MLPVAFPLTALSLHPEAPEKRAFLEPTLDGFASPYLPTLLLFPTLPATTQKESTPLGFAQSAPPTPGPPMHRVGLRGMYQMSAGNGAVALSGRTPERGSEGEGVKGFV